MKLKAPTPLGEENTIQQPKIDPVVNNNFTKPERIHPKFHFPKISIPGIDMSKIPKQKIVYISIIVVPIFLLIILSIMVITYTQSEPYRMAKKFIEYIDKMDTTNAYEMTTDAYRVLVPKKDFQKIVDKLNSVDLSKPKIKSKRIEEILGMGKYAYIRYKVSGYYLDITVFNDTIDWGIHSIEISIIE